MKISTTSVAIVISLLISLYAFTVNWIFFKISILVFGAVIFYNIIKKLGIDENTKIKARNSLIVTVFVWTYIIIFFPVTLQGFIVWGELTWLIFFGLEFVSKQTKRRFVFGICDAMENATNNIGRAIGDNLQRARENEQREREMDRLGEAIGRSIRGGNKESYGYSSRDPRDWYWNEKKRLSR